MDKKTKQKIAKELVNIAKDLTSADTLLPEYKKVYKGLEILRSKFEATSNEAIFISMLRDMALKAGRGQWGSVEKLAKDIQWQLDDSYE